MAACAAFGAYSHLHWEVLQDHYRELSPELKSALFKLLTGLEFYRLFGLVSLGFWIWSLRGRPRIASWLMLPAVVLGLLASIVVM